MARCIIWRTGGDDDHVVSSDLDVGVADIDDAAAAVAAVSVASLVVRGTIASRPPALVATNGSTVAVATPPPAPPTDNDKHGGSTSVQRDPQPALAKRTGLGAAAVMAVSVKKKGRY